VELGDRRPEGCFRFPGPSGSGLANCNQAGGVNKNPDWRGSDRSRAANARIPKKRDATNLAEKMKIPISGVFCPAARPRPFLRGVRTDQAILRLQLMVLIPLNFCTLPDEAVFFGRPIHLQRAIWFPEQS
jgi:hypothetical protein